MPLRLSMLFLDVYRLYKCVTYMMIKINYDEVPWSVILVLEEATLLCDCNTTSHSEWVEPDSIVANRAEFPTHATMAVGSKWERM